MYGRFLGVLKAKRQAARHQEVFLSSTPAFRRRTGRGLRIAVLVGEWRFPIRLVALRITTFYVPPPRPPEILSSPEKENGSILNHI